MDMGMIDCASFLVFSNVFFYAVLLQLAFLYKFFKTVFTSAG